MQIKNFNNIYKTYYRKSYLFVKSYVHDDFIAEDIVSEAMIKIWEKMKQEHLEFVQPYLFTILKNRALDHLKHEAVKHVVLSERLTRELHVRTSILQSLDPNEIFSDEIHDIVHQTLALLPEKSRRVFEFSRFQYKSNKEIAEIFDISVKGVDYHISLTINKLRKALRDYLPSFCYFFAL